jgi:GNAT superfamily N-acetyltransferase
MHPVVRPDPPPPGYPRELEREVTLADGGVVFVRPVVPEDAEALGGEILTADTETLYHRFFTTAVEPDRETLDRLTVLDYEKALALGCIDLASGEAAGIARYSELDGASVEIAVAVKPAWRRRGIATLLLDAIETAAAARGYTTMSALHLGENRAAAALLAGRGYEVVGAERGVVEVIRRI